MTPVVIKNKRVKYDRSHDVLHLYFGPQVYAFDDEDFPGIIIRRATDDNRIIGVRILDYSTRDLRILKMLMPFLDIDVLQGLNIHK